MRKLFLALVFSLLFLNKIFAVPDNTMSITPAATDATTITASDENTRNSGISTTYNAHSHSNKASTALSDLASVAINTSLTSDTADTDDLGTEAIFWRKLYLRSDISFEGTTDNDYQTTLTAADTASSDKTITLPNATGAVMLSTLTTNAPDVANSVTGGTNQLIFEGATGDTIQTLLTPTDPTASDKTQTLQNNSGIIPLGTAGNTLFFTTSGATSVTLPTTGTLSSYSDTMFKIGTFDREMDAATGNVAYTGVGFTPRVMLFFGTVSSTTKTTLIGIDNITSKGCLADNSGVSATTYTSSGIALYFIEAVGKNQTAILNSFDADGFTLAWTRAGATAAGTANIYYMAIK